LVTNLLGTPKGFQTSKLIPVGKAHLHSFGSANLDESVLAKIV